MIEFLNSFLLGHVLQNIRFKDRSAFHYVSLRVQISGWHTATYERQLLFITLADDKDRSLTSYKVFKVQDFRKHSPKARGNLI